MENKTPDHKKVNKIRRKLLIGAAAAPLIVTLRSSQAMAEYINIESLTKNPSKAFRDGVGYSGVLNSPESGGTAETELSLYVYMAKNIPNPSSSYYREFLRKHTQAIGELALTAPDGGQEDTKVETMREALIGACEANGVAWPSDGPQEWIELESRYNRIEP